MTKKHRVDGISLAIVILNILIAATVIVLIVLIYLYMTGKLEPTDVANMDESGEVAQITTTAVTTGEAVGMETTADTEETTAETEEFIVTDTTTEETSEEPAETVEAAETDDYDPGFFANDLFIGDSIYTGLVNYGYFESSNVFAQIGLNPESARTKAYDGYTSVSKAQEMQPKRIFIMLGSNGLAYMGNTYMSEQMALLVNELKAVCPDSYIYVVSIPPVTKAHDSAGQETMVMVNGYNKLLKGMCEEVGVVFLDLCSELEDSSGYFSADYAEADGLHFLGSAYKHMLSFFQKSIQIS